MRNFGHRTAVAQHNAVLAEDLTDFREGDRVMTIDGVAGRVTGVLFGPYQGTESYQVELDNGMGGGDYAPGQLTKPKKATATTASIPVEAITEHTANTDYPELEDILERRLPIENLKHYASAKGDRKYGYDHGYRWALLKNEDPELHGEEGWSHDQDEASAQASQMAGRDSHHFHEGFLHGVRGYHSQVEEHGPQKYAAVNKDDEASRPDSSADDSTENLEMEQQAGEANPDGVPDPELDSDDPDSEESEEEGTDAKLGDVTMPSACSYCGGSTFGDTQMTGRGVRVRCEACGGTMKSWGGQWEPEFPNSSQNRASEQGDYRSGGAAGIAAAPGAMPDVTSPDDNASKKLNGEDDEDGKTIKIKVSSILDGMTNPQIAESLQSQAGIVQYLFNRIYEKARQRYEDKQIEWWQPPANQIGTELAGPAQYHVITPGHVTVGSVSEYDDPNWQWHFTASWMDVQAKARRIRKEGHVKIVSASKMFVTAEVNGDQAIYETQLNYVPGTRKVADWACGCKWASYAWGRSKRYQRFEGRLCSHALATQYEASARGIFGREIEPDRVRPDWQSASSPVVVQYDKSKGRDLTRRAVPPANMRRTFSALVLDSDGVYPEPRYLDLQHPPVYASVQTMIDNRSNLADVIEMLASVGVAQDDAKGMVLEALLSPPADEGYLGHPDGSESGSALESEASKQHHHKKHVTHQEHGITYGRGWGPWAWCMGCGGSGCNTCNGTGQVPQGDPTGAGAGGAVDAGGAVGGGGATASSSWVCESTLPDKDHDHDHVCAHEDAHEGDHMCMCGNKWHNPGGEVYEPFPWDARHRRGALKTADYSTADPLAGMDAGQMFRPTTPHSNSHNPASTGWATSADPGDWGKSLISNDFGVTFDAALHKESIEDFDFPQQHHVVEYDSGGRRMFDAPDNYSFPTRDHAERYVNWLGRKHEELYGKPMPEGKFKVHSPRPTVIEHEPRSNFELPGRTIDASLHTAADDELQNLLNQYHALRAHPDWGDRGGKGYQLRKQMAAISPRLRELQQEKRNSHQADKHNWVDTQLGDGGSSTEHRFVEPHHVGACPGCGRTLLDEEKSDGRCTDCIWAQHGSDMGGGHRPGQHGEVVDQDWYNHEYEPARLHTLNSLHEAGGRHYAPSPSQTQYSYEIGQAHGYKWAQDLDGGRHEQSPEQAGAEAAEAHEAGGNPGMKYHYLDGWHDGVSMHLPRTAATEPLGSITDAAADHLARMFDSSLNDTPEPALPSTTGDEDPGTENDPGNSGTMPGDDAFDNTSGNISGVDQYNTMSTVGNLTEEQRIVAEFQMTAGARALQKEAAKDFSFDEQQDLINEGRGARARNFNDLNVTGTHYELIGDDADDETILWI